MNDRSPGIVCRREVRGHDEFSDAARGEEEPDGYAGCVYDVVRVD